MDVSVLKLLNSISVETEVNLVLKEENENLDEFLKEFCFSKSPSCLFSTNAVKLASTKDLLLTLKILLNYNFVVEWFLLAETFEKLKLINDGVTIMNLSEIVYINAITPQFPEDKCLDEVNCKDFIQCSELGLEIFLKLLDFINIDKYIIKAWQRYTVTTFAMLLCFEHSEIYRWSSEDSVYLSTKLQSNLLADTSLKFFLMEQSSWQPDACRFTDMVKMISSRLKSSNWKQNPASLRVLLTMLENCNFNVGCDFVLPPILLLLDDFEEKNIKSGLDGLNCILQNSTRVELKRMERIYVIYESLIKQLSTKNEFILEKTLQNLLLVLHVTSSKLQDFGKEDKCDKTLDLILQQMQIEKRLAIRRTYCFHLLDFVELLGLACLKHRKLIFEVVFSYLECYDGKREECRINVLHLLIEVVRVCWPRIHFNASDITKSMVRLLHELCSPSYDGEAYVREIMMKLIADCLKTLQHLAPEIKDSLDSLLTLNLADDFHSVLVEISKGMV